MQSIKTLTRRVGRQKMPDNRNAQTSITNHEYDKLQMHVLCSGTKPVNDAAAKAGREAAWHAAQAALNMSGLAKVTQRAAASKKKERSMHYVLGLTTADEGEEGDGAVTVDEIQDP